MEFQPTVQGTLDAVSLWKPTPSQLASEVGEGPGKLCDADSQAWARYAVYGKAPADAADPVGEWMNFCFGERERQNIAEVIDFLHKEEIIPAAALPEGAVDDSVARKLFQVSGHKPARPDAALGAIEGARGEAWPFKD